MPQEHQSTYSGSLFFLSACITFCMFLWTLVDYMPRYCVIFDPGNPLDHRRAKLPGFA